MSTPDAEKLNRVREEMAADNVDVLVCRLTENVLFLTGYYCIMGFSAVVFPREGEPILVAPRGEGDWVADGWVTDVRIFTIFKEHEPGSPSEQIARRLKEIGAEGKFPTARIGYEGSFEQIAPPVLAAEPVVPTATSLAAIKDAFPDAELVDATGVLNRARRLKTAYDVEKLRRVNEVGAFGYAAWREACLAKSTEAEAAAAFQHAVTAEGIGYNGARFAMAWPQVSSGLTTGIWGDYQPTTAKRIEEGDFVLCEVAVCVDGYWADLTRTLVVGEPNERQLQLFELARGSLEVGIENTRPGVRGADIDRMCREALGDHRQYLEHHVGHGLGWRYHEPFPALTPSSEHVLEAGMYFAIEPAVYVGGFGGCRNEENVLVTENGADVLSRVIPIGL